MEPSSLRPDRKIVEAAFHAMLDRLRVDPEASRSYLGAQPEALRSELERMLEDYRLVLAALGGTRDGVLPGRRLGEYEVIGELGRGGMGSVWEALHRSLRRRVALKILHPHLSISPQAIERFRREALAGARLSHPGIVAIYETGEDGGTNFLAMELVPGGFTLADRIAEWRRVPERGGNHWIELARFFVAVADALEAAHCLGVIHRDIKPGNILIGDHGQPRIADFGLARLQDELAISRTGEVTGTPYYMSPEQANGRVSGVSASTDVFALGVTLYEAITLYRPFEAETVPLLLDRIVREDPVDPRQHRADIPRDLAAVTMKALEKRASDRYASAHAMADDLRRFLANEPVTARTPGPVQRLTKWASRHPAWGATVGVAAVALVVLAMQFVSLRHEQALTSRMLAIANSAVRIVDHRGVRAGEKDNLGEFHREVIDLLPDLVHRPDDQVRLLLALGRVFSAAREHGEALEAFSRAVALLPTVNGLSSEERADVYLLTGMECLLAYELQDARDALQEALMITQKLWPSKNAEGHWDDPHVLDVAAQYALCLRRACDKNGLKHLVDRFGDPGQWMAARWKALKDARGESDPATIDAGAALARWCHDEQTVAGGNQRAKQIYDELVPLAAARFGLTDSRALELRLMALSAWERTGVTPSTARDEIRPRLEELWDEAERKHGRDHWLTLLTEWRMIVNLIDGQDTDVAVRKCPELIFRMSQSLGDRHINTYDVRTDYGIALAHEDMPEAVDVLGELIDDMRQDQSITVVHEVCLIARRALALALQARGDNAQRRQVLQELFRDRGGWESIAGSETRVEIMDCLAAAAAAGQFDSAEEILREFPTRFSEALQAAGLNPTEFPDYFNNIFTCLDVAARSELKASEQRMLESIQQCKPRNPDGGAFLIPLFKQARIVELTGSPRQAEDLYRASLEAAEPDCGEMYGQFLVGEGRIEEAIAVFERGIAAAGDKLVKRQLQKRVEKLRKR
jgi:tetratricopeptide (TPR) repeat protein